MLNIPSNLYSHQILLWLNTHPTTREDEAIVDILRKVCGRSLSKLGDLKLSQTERDTLRAIDWKSFSNLYIKACCLDILRHKDKDKLLFTREASDAYLQLFIDTEHHGKTDIQYLLHSINVRSIKPLVDTDYLAQIVACFSRIPIGGISVCVDALCKSYSIDQLKIVVPLVQNKKQEAIKAKNYTNERKCLDLLLRLLEIDKDTYNLQMALSFENEIKYVQDTAKENTIYMHLPDLSKEAYRHIYEVRDTYKTEHKRIDTLMKQSCGKQSSIVSALGLSAFSNSNFTYEEKCEIDEKVQTITFSTIDDVFAVLQSIPFPTNELVRDIMKIHKEKAPITSSFGIKRINSEGRTIGSKKPDESLKTLVHIELRNRTHFVLGQYYFKIIESGTDLSGEHIFEYLQCNHPSCVNNDILYLLAKGISEGFSNDFVSATHILTPTLERLLRSFVESKCGSIAKWEKDIQEDSTLGKIMSMIQKNNLLDEEIYFELHSFLESGIDVNYRNNLMHGLMPVKQIVSEGIYLWWLCIKLLQILPKE